MEKELINEKRHYKLEEREHDDDFLDIFFEEEDTYKNKRERDEGEASNPFFAEMLLQLVEKKLQRSSRGTM